MSKSLTGRSFSSLLALILAAAAGVMTPGRLLAEDNFYDRRQVRFIIAHAAGSPYDSFARLVIRHMGRHIPGNPSFVPQNMLGAVGMTAMNTLFNGVPQDGSVIGQAGKSVILEPLYGNELAKFDPLKLNWIGSGQSDVSLCFTRLDSDVKTVEDARRRIVMVGATGPTGDSSFVSHLVNRFLGTKLKPVLGYPDTPTVALAMDRQELDGGCGYTSSTLRATRPDWFEQKKINIFLQATLERSRAFPLVPSLGDYVTNVEEREALKIAVSTDPLVRTFVAPPGVPEERVRILRTGFMATMRDTAFLEEARIAQFEIDAIDGVEVEKILRRIYGGPRSAIDLILAVRATAAASGFETTKPKP